MCVCVCVLTLHNCVQGIWTRQCQAMFTDPCTDLPYIDEMIVILTVEFHLPWQVILVGTLDPHHKLHEYIDGDDVWWPSLSHFGWKTKPIWAYLIIILFSPFGPVLLLFYSFEIIYANSLLFYLAHLSLSHCYFIYLKSFMLNSLIWWAEPNNEMF